MSAPEPTPEAGGPPPRYVLKSREFIAVNAPRGTDEKSADHDVHEILKHVRAREAAAGLDEVAPMARPRLRRKRDYLLLLLGGNGLMLTLFLMELFLGFQIQCLAAGMPGEFGRLVYYAWHDGRPMFLLPGALMAGYSVMLSWLMFGVMGKY